MFADDTNIYYENESLVELELIVNKELRNLYLWLSVHRLALNIAKTNFLIFHPFNKSLKYNVTLKILKQAIVEKNCIKYLGVIIDSTLSWKDQLHNLSKKLSRTIGVLYQRHLFQLRVGLSHLRYHKKCHNFADTPSDICLCMRGVEDTSHFLLFCPLFITHREIYIYIMKILTKIYPMLTIANIIQ